MAQNIKAAKEAVQILHGAEQAGAGRKDGSRLMKHGQQDHLQFLKKMKGNLHVATCVSMCRFNKALARMMLVVVMPVRISHGQAQNMFATRRGGAERQIAVASGAWMQAVIELAALTQDHSKLIEVGFRKAVSEPFGALGEEEE